MKFINYLESITGIGIYPMASLMIFFIFFAAVTFYAFGMRKELVNKVKQMPLDL
jgi:cbb3-type cytochrome oxidase subunit 3